MFRVVQGEEERVRRAKAGPGSTRRSSGKGKAAPENMKEEKTKRVAPSCALCAESSTEKTYLR